MNIAEILKAKGVSDELVKAIQEEMKANNVYTASEENLDLRYGKLKTEHEGKLAELSEAQNLIAELKKSNKGNEDLQGKITAYETQVAQLQAELEKTKLEAAIKVELLASKALDVDYLTFKLKEKGELALDENGKVKGWEDKLAALKTQLPTQFGAGDDGSGNGGFTPYENNGLPKGGGDKTVTKEQFTAMSFEERVALKKSNEALYKQYAKN